MPRLHRMGLPHRRTVDPRLPLIARMQPELQRLIGTGVDATRMCGDPLYERDVLLVCDACTGTPLPALARAYRAARTPVATAADTAAPAPARRRRRDDDHAAPQQAPRPAAITGPVSTAPARPAPGLRSFWLSPRRWFGA